MPERFTKERDDRLMNSILDKYSIETSEDGVKTGHFFCNREGAQALSNEVQGSHGNADAYGGNGKRFEEVWNHFDVNHDGLVESERMPQFLRMLLGNALDIDLQ